MLVETPRTLDAASPDAAQALLGEPAGLAEEAGPRLGEAGALLLLLLSESLPAGPLPARAAAALPFPLLREVFVC
jgi:hypothetical protein